MSSQPQLTSSMIFQDGYCTTNQLYIFVHRESRKPIVGSPERNASPGYAMVFETFCHWVTLSANKPSVRKPGYSRKPVNSMVFPTWWHFKNHIVSHCFILFHIVWHFGDRVLFQKAQRHQYLQIFPAQTLGQRHTSGPNKWGWRAVAFFADLDLVHTLQKLAGMSFGYNLNTGSSWSEFWNSNIL